jgi:uncharacterized protein (DUF488 family)
MKIFTIGFTKTSAKHFFDRLKRSGAKTLVDVRLNNVSQLAGFAKRDDLDYFVHQLCNIDYIQLPALAPGKDMLDDYKKNGGSWDAYAAKFLSLMAQRRIESIDKAALDAGCLLCSEDKPHHCHRRLVAEYLRDKWHDVEIVHL